MVTFGVTYKPFRTQIESIVAAAKALPQYGFILGLNPENTEFLDIVKEANLPNTYSKGFIP